MRTIKFRGKRLDNGKWVYGDLQHPHTSCRIIGYDESETDMGLRTDFRYNDVIPETVGQFTGLLDKDGKEIYEGDVIQSDRKDIVIRHFIRYDEERARFVAILINEYVNTDCEISCEINSRWIAEYGKAIIANIYDNIELLKGGEE